MGTEHESEAMMTATAVRERTTVKWAEETAVEDSRKTVKAAVVVSAAMAMTVAELMMGRTK